MDISRLGIAVESRTVDDATHALEKFVQVSGSAERAAKGMGKETTTAGRAAAAANDNAAGSANRAAMAYGKWEMAARMVGRAIGLITAALATGALARYADTWSDINARVALASGSTEAGAAVMERLGTVARRTYSDLANTAESYIGNATALRELGYSTLQQLDYTEALNLALVVSGARAERAASVTNALTKAMAAGKLSGDELNTVIQTGGRVAEVIAEKMGVTVNQLRQLGADGKITGDIIYTSLTGNLELLQEQAESMPATIGDAFTLLRNSLLEWIGGMDQATGTSARLAEAIIYLGDNIGVIARVAAVAGVALVTAFAPAILAAMAAGLMAIGTAGVAAMSAITVAIMANPFGALAVAITTVITAVWLFRDEIKQAVGVDVAEIVKGTANTIVGLFVGAYNAVVEAWGNLPTFFSAIGKQAWNSFIAEFEKPAWEIGGKVIVPGFDLSGMKGSLSEAETAALGGAKATMVQATNTDYFPGWGGSGGDSAPDAAAIEELNRQLNAVNGNAGSAGAAMDEAGKKSAKAAEKAAREAQKLSDAYAGIVTGAERHIAASRAEAAALGQTAEQAAALKYQTDMLNQARDAGINLTAAQTAELNALGSQMAATEAATAKAKEQMEFNRETTRGFVEDLRYGLNAGEGLWGSFKNAALNALDSIIDRIQNQLIDALFSAGQAGGGGGGGGLLGALTGLLGGGFGSGTVSSGATAAIMANPFGGFFADGGTLGAGKWGIAGENGPEIIKGPAQVIPNHQMPRVRSAANDGGPIQLEVTWSASVDTNGNLMPFVEAVSTKAAEQGRDQAVRIVHKGLPDMIGDAKRRGTTR
ncbi:tape measure protein [Aurantimonas endophytica]|uniref:Tape measure domain-containing protein n=1 Tax=Aurantimonas endophytica TaxID=1522175 RepID=A0A7W6H993_9HYPH|nr:tape measure protein [Aurantimonas endophytica]MBB4000970.1 tape measure domain-containing protein [Aurantimonas endophytica]MCO6403371.1 tape measure protein [Aurantimonas endophytica]